MILPHIAKAVSAIAGLCDLRFIPALKHVTYIETIILFTSQDNFPWGFYLQSGFAEMAGMRMMACGPTE